MFSGHGAGGGGGAPVLGLVEYKGGREGRVVLSRLADPGTGRQRMFRAKLSLWLMLVVLVVKLSTCEGYNLNAPEELETMERQLRAPFNGMRGKRGPFSLNMYKKVKQF